MVSEMLTKENGARDCLYRFWISGRAVTVAIVAVSGKESFKKKQC